MHTLITSTDSLAMIEKAQADGITAQYVVISAYRDLSMPGQQSGAESGNTF
ncbi:hypothetical protein [Hungatella sp. SL.1.14]|uniref:hypothetical protein n=1 Tax=Hungatella sp. SL.1.14 TaxID=2963703 RepID=UPI00210C0716|nr:hypothetical protein [Hungatella sp. SL.1.14]MCQ4833372.1 hypothetical protein [Hungatella sp. SL.1.14]